MSCSKIGGGVGVLAHQCSEQMQMSYLTYTQVNDGEKLLELAYKFIKQITDVNKTTT